MSYIIVGLSGGVDSAVAAYLLQKAGHQIYTATAIVWPGSLCCDNAAILAAKKIANDLKLSHQVIEVTEEFARDVINPFIESYFAGKTPNPCTLCNRYSRFDVFYHKAVELIKKKYKIPAKEIVYIATGHYLNVKVKNDRYLIQKGRDKNKDQSYMLYDLTQEQLAKLITPLGKLTKTKVRKIATQAGLEVAQKADSQDICFANGDYKKFIVEYSGKESETGSFVDKNEKILGKHQGIPFYTIGQRRGLNISYREPLYVIGINPVANTVILGTKKELLTNNLKVSGINWLIKRPFKKIVAKIKVRYNSPPVTGIIDPESGKVILKKKIEAITPGQIAAFYKGSYLIGGGIIERSDNYE